MAPLVARNGGVDEEHHQVKVLDTEKDALEVTWFYERDDALFLFGKV